MIGYFCVHVALAHQYYDMWTVQYAELVRTLPPDDVLFVRYEDLTGKNTRQGALRSILAFLGKKDASMQLLQCAFASAEKKIVSLNKLDRAPVV